MISVYRNGNEFLVRSHFSKEKDIVIRNIKIVNEAAYLINPDTPLEQYSQKGTVLHVSSDEYPATAPLGAFGTLSGNHGSPFARTLLIPDHSFSEKDLGQRLHSFC